MKLIIQWQSNYNGVGIYSDVDNTKEEEDFIDEIIDDLNDDASVVLPGYTYDCTPRYESLSEDNIQTLKELAMPIIQKYIPDFNINDLDYEEDSTST